MIAPKSAPIAIFLLGIGLGGAVVYLISPTKIKTQYVDKVVTKIEKQNVYVDRVVIKTTTKDGKVVEVIKEKDRSVVATDTRSREKSEIVEILNPKKFTLGVLYKNSITSFRVPSFQNLGIQATFDTGLLNTYISGAFFMDSTVMVGVGIRF
jgi:hypothetical protein